jgi:hypothetical protein
MEVEVLAGLATATTTSSTFLEGFNMTRVMRTVYPARISPETVDEVNGVNEHCALSKKQIQNQTSIKLSSSKLGE